MDGQEVREGLGLTAERADELEKITLAIMRRTSQPDGHRGITSHTLLTILGMKDLSELEKVYCTYMFCRMTRISKKNKLDNVDMPMSNLSMFMDKDIDMDIGIIDMGTIEFKPDSPGTMITSSGVDQRKMASVIIAMLIALLGQLPKDEAKEFCKGASITFMRMAMTGDMRL